MTAWYALVDTARDPALFGLVKRARRQECLFSGDLAPVLAAASPYLVAVDGAEALLAAWRENGSGQNWGIMAESELAFDALRRHFKKFLNVRLPDGTIALFRFYDPRVFGTYIRACTDEERAPWFEGVRRYAVEDEDGAIHNYRLRGGRLHDGDTATG